MIIRNSIKVHIPHLGWNQSHVLKMKCQVNSNFTRDVWISGEIRYKSYKEICGGEPKKVNLGYWGNRAALKVENNSLIHSPRVLKQYIRGKYSNMIHNWEVLSKFFSFHNIEPNWLYCNKTYGWYDYELGGWTGCMGKV